MIKMKFLKLFIFVFLFPNTEVSSSSSCEELRNILYSPIRSCEGDIYQEDNFRFDCEGNSPIIYMQSTKFLVKDISFQNTTFRLVDSSFSATEDHCYLPNKTISWDYAFSSFLLYNSDYSFIYFVNCTQEIEDSRYQLFPCLNRTNFRVYAIKLWLLDGVYGLHDSCSLVGRAMAPYGIDEPPEHVGYAAIIQDIEKGVLVNWTFPYPCPNFEQCLGYRSNLWAFQQWKGFRVSEFLFLSLQPSSFLTFLLYKLSSIIRCLYYSSNAALGVFLIAVVLFFFCIILVMFLTRIILAPLTVCSFLIHKWWRTSSSVSLIEKFLRKNDLLRVRRYDFIELSIMTNHFREKLGQGGFGSVYKGKILSGQQVAVKVLSNPIGDGDDFISEVATIGRIHHTNIVRLIGFCSEGPKRALIYAYMPNGSLDQCIFSLISNDLPMEKRKEIAVGIARGIDYLHRGCEMQILHFDIKPHNILLDHNFIPKISDFGLARLYPRDYSLVTLSMARGTIGYIAPELISRTFGAISNKADVYSFGMMLMEMASSRRNVNNHAESSSKVYYPSWVYDQLNLPEEAPDLSSDVEKFGEIEERLYKVALWCIQMKASNRPTMSRVIEMLQSDENTVEMPPRPFAACTPHEFSVRPSGNESSSIELSSISEEIRMI